MRQTPPNSSDEILGFPPFKPNKRLRSPRKFRQTPIDDGSRQRPTTTSVLLCTSDNNPTTDELLPRTAQWQRNKKSTATANHERRCWAKR